MSIKISELPSATSVSENDIVPIVQGGTTKKADITKFSNASSVPMGATFQFDGDTIPTGYEEVNGLETYSTTEQKVGTWINGKPIYKITLQDTLPNTNTDGNITEKQVDVSNLNIDMVTLVQGFVYSSAGNTMMMPNIENNVSRLEKCYCGPTNLVIGNSAIARNGSTCYITIFYTKTTDSAS